VRMGHTRIGGTLTGVIRKKVNGELEKGGGPGLGETNHVLRKTRGQKGGILGRGRRIGPCL